MRWSVRSVMGIHYPLFCSRRCVYPSRLGLRDTLDIAPKISIVLRRSGDRLCGNQLGTGLQAMQLSPHHAGLAGLQFLRLLFASRFPTMLLSPNLSASGKMGDL